MLVYVQDTYIIRTEPYIIGFDITISINDKMQTDWLDTGSLKMNIYLYHSKWIDVYEFLKYFVPMGAIVFIAKLMF